MDRLIHVQGDHPIFAYVDKYLWNPDDVKKLVEELQSYNYENIKIDGKEIEDGYETV